MYVPTNIKQFASTHETSDAIALAIFNLADEGDEERLWADPTDEEIYAVTECAWSYVSADVDVLHWGNEHFNRS